MELLLVDLCKDTVLKRPTPARTTTAGAVFDVPTFGLFRSKNRPSTTVHTLKPVAFEEYLEVLPFQYFWHCLP